MKLSTRIKTGAAFALLLLILLPPTGAASVRLVTTGRCVSPSAEALVSSKPHFKGAVRVRKRKSGWVVEAPLGRAPSYVSQSFRASSDVNVAFRMRARAGATTKLLLLKPGGVSLILRRGHLKLEVAHPGRVSQPSQLLSLTRGSKRVALGIDGGAGSVRLTIDGVSQGSFLGLPFAPSGVQIGSLAPARRSSVTLNDVRIATCAGTIIPSPARPRPTTHPSPTAPGATAPGATAPGAPAPGGSSGAGPGCASSAPWPAQNPFAPTSFWNAPLPANAALDPNSQAYVANLVWQVKTYKPWINTTTNSVPVYVAAAGQPTQHVTLDTYGPDLQAEFNAVPIPCGAQPAAGSDANMVVWQPSTDKMWEFTHMQQESDGWNASWGGEIDDLSNDPGYFTHSGLTNNWGSTATGLPLLGGLVTEADLQRGYINHALAISLVQTEPAYWSWPAQRTDGDTWTAGITPIPEGTRFRLDPSLNIASLHLPPIDQMLAKAAQTYGIVVRDKGGAVSFYGQDPKSLPADPWPAAFDNQYANNVLALFPWSHLEALKTQLSCCWQPVTPKK